MTKLEQLTVKIESSGKKAEFLRFILVGGFATVLQYVFYLIISELVGISAAFAAGASYLISLVFNFILSNFFTFRTQVNTKKAVSFITSHAINLSLQTILVAVFSGIVEKSLALLPAMAICIPINFILVRFSLTSKFVQ